MGSGHSLNSIAVPDPGEWVVSLDRMAQIIAIDLDRNTIEAEAGATLKQINEALAAKGLALENLGSISDQTVGGVFQTGTHGTGGAFGPLHTQIVELTVIDGRGVRKKVSPHCDPLLFRAWQCGLGSLGIAERVTLRAVPAKNLRERISPALWPQLLDEIEAWIQNNLHFRCYWFPYTPCAGVWTANPAGKGEAQALVAENPRAGNSEALLALGATDPAVIEQYNRAFFEESFGTPKERIERSDRILNVDCSAHSHCVAMEAAVPASSTKQFLLDLQKLIESNRYPVHCGVEIRFVKGDDALLSPAYSERENALFCFVSVVTLRPQNQEVAYRPFHEAFQALAQQHEGRLHWGKMGKFDREDLARAYPEWETFLKLRHEEDPLGLFLNEFTRNVFD